MPLKSNRTKANALLASSEAEALKPALFLRTMMMLWKAFLLLGAACTHTTIRRAILETHGMYRYQSFSFPVNSNQSRLYGQLLPPTFIEMEVIPRNKGELQSVGMLLLIVNCSPLAIPVFPQTIEMVIPFLLKQNRIIYYFFRQNNLQKIDHLDNCKKECLRCFHVPFSLIPF